APSNGLRRGGVAATAVDSTRAALRTESARAVTVARPTGLCVGGVGRPGTQDAPAMSAAPKSVRRARRDAMIDLGSVRMCRMRNGVARLVAPQPPGSLDASRAWMH